MYIVCEYVEASSYIRAPTNELDVPFRYHNEYKDSELVHRISMFKIRL